MPACIFHPISPPAWPFRLCRHGISPRVPAGRSRSLPRRRAFSSRFPAGMVVSTVTGRNFVTLCPLVAVVLRHAGVHFLFCFLASMAVSTVSAGNLPLCARWLQPFFAPPACIFISFPRRHGRLDGDGEEFCHLMPAGRCRSSPCRRAFFILFPRRHGRFDCAGGELASVCPLAAAILHLAGVHFSSYYPAS